MQQPKTGRKFSVAVGKFMDELDAQVPAAPPAQVALPSPARAETPQVPAPARPPSAPAPAQQPVAKGTAAAAPVEAALDAATAEVASKLQAFTAQLHSSGPHEAAHLLTLIRECAHTISDLNAAKASAK